MYIYVNIYKHVHRQTYIYTHTYKNIHTHTHTHKYIYLYKYTHKTFLIVFENASMIKRKMSHMK